MDGLRKVPSNIPNQESMSNYIGHPLTKVPDPFRLIHHLESTIIQDLNHF